MSALPVDVVAITPEKVAALEVEMLKQPQASCEVRHVFADGLYVREVHIPAGTYAVGHHQKFEHLNVMLKGVVEIVNEDGTTSLLRAPQTFIGRPGRKIGYVHEDMVWQNIYPAIERDVETLEERFLDKSEAFADSVVKLPPPGADDYPLMLADLRVSHALVQQQSENEEDQIPFPVGSYKVKVAPSAIHGKGLFATAGIAPGEPIAPARIGGKRTPAGRYTNHSSQPNARMEAFGDDVVLVATQPISGCKGGQDGEEITVDYRQAVNLTLRMQQA